ncbi:hypothetical protein MTO96_000891 [Rhipicephalus appendiculatus]
MPASEKEVTFSPAHVAKAGSVFADLFAPAPAVVPGWGGPEPHAQSTDWPGQKTRESMKGEGPPTARAGEEEGYGGEIRLIDDVTARHAKCPKVYLVRWRCAEPPRI